MPFNLLDAVNDLFTGDVINTVSTKLEEKDTAIKKAVNAIIPSVLAALAEKTSTTTGLNALSEAITEHQAIPDGSPDLLSFFGKKGRELLNKGVTVAKQILGNKMDNLIRNVSTYSGVAPSSASSLIGAIVPAIIGLLGKWNGPGKKTELAIMLDDQKTNILNGMPAGLSLGSLIGDATVREIGTERVSYKEKKSGSSFRWLLWLLPLILLAWAAWYFLGIGCNKTEVAPAVKIVDTIANTIVNTPQPIRGRIDSVSGDWMYDEGDSVLIALPNGKGDLKVGKYSTEAMLITFLADANASVDTVKGNWFELTNVHFKTGSADITDASKIQLNNIAAICQSFEKGRFKLGGYTDSTGSLETNLQVSQNRADAVMAYLKMQGVSESSFTGAKGYGPEWPIASNSTIEGRAQNRRVAVNVKAK